MLNANGSSISCCTLSKLISMTTFSCWRRIADSKYKNQNKMHIIPMAICNVQNELVEKFHTRTSHRLIKKTSNLSQYKQKITAFAEAINEH